MSLSEIEKKHSEALLSKWHVERKFALVQGLSHSNSRVNQYGTVRFDEEFVSFAAVLVFHNYALRGTYLDIKRGNDIYGDRVVDTEHVAYNKYDK